MVESAVAIAPSEMGLQKPIEIAPVPVVPEKPKLQEKTVPALEIIKPRPTKKLAQKAVLTHETAEFLTRCGLDSEKVNPVPLGQGANHLVYAYENGEEAQVIKIPKVKSKVTMNAGKEDEAFNLRTCQEAFGEFILPTKIMGNAETGDYCIVQKAVKGKSVSNKNLNPAILEQLEKITELNQKLFTEKKLALDFVGMPGFISWIQKQFSKLIMRKSVFEVSNLLIDEKDGRVYIIDYDLFNFKESFFSKKRLISSFGFFVNRLMMKHYFGVDIKKK